MVSEPVAFMERSTPPFADNVLSKNHKKRRWESVRDDEELLDTPLDSPDPYSVTIDDEGPSDQASTLKVLLDSVLGVKDKQPSDVRTETNQPPLEIACDVLADETTEQENSFETAQVADVSRRIEVWAEQKTIAPSVAEVQSPGLDIDSEQCYGMLHGCEARFIRDLRYLRDQVGRRFSMDKWTSFKVSFDSHICTLKLEDTIICGQLKDGLYDPLHQIYDKFSVKLSAHVLTEECLRVIERAKRQGEAAIKVEVNIYGSSSVRDEVGRILSCNGLYLQHPRCSCDGIEYANPHMLSYDDSNLIDLPGEQGESPVQIDDPEEIQRTILEICDYETRDEDVTNESLDMPSDTTLFPHQTRAVQFMIEREIGPIPEALKLWQHAVEENRAGFKHVITESWATEPYTETGSGLLADEMGMGKTRSTLSLIAKRLPHARQWFQSGNDPIPEPKVAETRSKATLVVVPSLLIMNDCWINELKGGLYTSLQYFKYHGKKRAIPNNRQQLLESDIILTTYHTLATESKSKSAPMKSIKWFRIVLDEAHTVRRRATRLFSAVAELDACYRWCLTGTPIQNQLSDLGTLLAFLRVDPLESASVFRKYVVMPFSPLSQDLPAAKLKLSLLLKSICIRRKRERLHLPPVEEVFRKIELSEQERSRYEETFQKMSYKLSHGSRERYSGTALGWFQIQLQLRRVCNHGTFQEIWTSGEDDNQIQREDFFSSIGKDGEVKCSLCREKTLILATNSTARRKLPSCTHIICHDCLSQASEEASTPDSTPACPCCTNHESSIWTQDSLPMIGSRSKKSSLLSTGYSSKMEALVTDMKDRLDSTKRCVYSLFIPETPSNRKAYRFQALCSRLGPHHWISFSGIL